MGFGYIGIWLSLNLEFSYKLSGLDVVKGSKQACWFEQTHVTAQITSMSNAGTEKVLVGTRLIDLEGCNVEPTRKRRLSVPYLKPNLSMETERWRGWSKHL